ncbi:MAG TPA: ribosome-associated translation inhibitor RaiA [Sphingobacteriaceae bacterium]
MNITIQSIHFTANAALLDFVETKVKKLGTFYSNILHAEIYLKLEPSETDENKVAEIKLNIPGSSLFAKERCKTFEESTDLAIESLVRQLEKQKRREQTQPSALSN